MPCLANLNEITPLQVLAPLPVTTEPALVPAGASCVTLTFRLCANDLALENQAEIRVFWSAPGDVPLSQEVVVQQTAVCGVFETCFRVDTSPPVADGCIVFDLTFPIPAGKTDVQVEVTEVGDPANPGTIEVWVAFR